MADARKSEQFHHKLPEPGGVLPEMNQPGMKLGRLRRKPHDLVALSFESRERFTDRIEHSSDVAGVGASVPELNCLFFLSYCRMLKSPSLQ